MSIRVLRFARMAGAAAAEIECALAADVCAVFDAVVSGVLEEPTVRRLEGFRRVGPRSHPVCELTTSGWARRFVVLYTRSCSHPTDGACSFPPEQPVRSALESAVATTPVAPLRLLSRTQGLATSNPTGLFQRMILKKLFRHFFPASAIVVTRAHRTRPKSAWSRQSSTRRHHIFTSTRRLGSRRRRPPPRFLLLRLLMRMLPCRQQQEQQEQHRNRHLRVRQTQHNKYKLPACLIFFGDGNWRVGRSLHGFPGLPEFGSAAVNNAKAGRNAGLIGGSTRSRDAGVFLLFCLEHVWSQDSLV